MGDNVDTINNENPGEITSIKGADVDAEMIVNGESATTKATSDNEQDSEGAGKYNPQDGSESRSDDGSTNGNEVTSESGSDDEEEGGSGSDDDSKTVSTASTASSFKINKDPIGDQLEGKSEKITLNELNEALKDINVQVTSMEVNNNDLEIKFESMQSGGRKTKRRKNMKKNKSQKKKRKQSKKKGGKKSKKSNTRKCA